LAFEFQHMVYKRYEYYLNGKKINDIFGIFFFFRKLIRFCSISLKKAGNFLVV